MRPSYALKISGGGLRRGQSWLFRDLNLELSKGQFLGLRGPSGIGKTSLLEVFAQTSQLTEGSIERTNTGLAWIDQGCSLSPNLSAGENILLGCLKQRSWVQTLFGLSTLNDCDLTELLDELDLNIPLSTQASLLSGGEKQRVSIARAVHTQSDLLLADEPISMLQADLQLRVLRRIKKQTDLGTTVVCVLHNDALLEQFADQILEFDHNHWSLK